MSEQSWQAMKNESDEWEEPEQAAHYAPKSEPDEPITLRSCAELGWKVFKEHRLHPVPTSASTCINGMTLYFAANRGDGVEINGIGLTEPITTMRQLRQLVTALTPAVKP